MEKQHEMPLKFTNKEKLILKRTEGDEYTYLDIAIDKGREHLSLLKLEDSEESGLRLHVYPTPEVEEPQTISLNSYRGVSSLNLTETERAKAEEKLLDILLEINHRGNGELLENLLMSGVSGIEHKSDYELMTELGFNDVREFKKELN